VKVCPTDPPKPRSHTKNGYALSPIIIYILRKKGLKGNPLNRIIISEMEDKANNGEQYHTCDDCGRYCYTGGDQYPDGYICVDCDEDYCYNCKELIEECGCEFDYV
jgi:hypothetical protein